MLTSMWMWSLRASASRTSTPLYPNSFRSIWPMSCFIFSQIICRRYFGANTIWYLHSHFVCAKLLTSSFIHTWFLLWWFTGGWQTTSILPKEDTFSEHSESFLEPPAVPVVFFYNKKEGRLHTEKSFLVTPGRIELPISPWEGDVLAAWPRGHKLTFRRQLPTVAELVCMQ